MLACALGRQPDGRSRGQAGRTLPLINVGLFEVAAFDDGDHGWIEMSLHRFVDLRWREGGHFGFELIIPLQSASPALILRSSARWSSSPRLSMRSSSQAFLAFSSSS